MKMREAPVLHASAAVQSRYRTHLRFLQQTLDFGIILIVDKVLLGAWEGIDLEALLVQGILVSLSADIMNCDIGGSNRSLVCLRFPNVLARVSERRYR